MPSHGGSALSTPTFPVPPFPKHCPSVPSVCPPSLNNVSPSALHLVLKFCFLEIPNMWKEKIILWAGLAQKGQYSCHSFSEKLRELWFRDRQCWANPTGARTSWWRRRTDLLKWEFTQPTALSCCLLWSWTKKPGHWWEFCMNNAWWPGMVEALKTDISQNDNGLRLSQTFQLNSTNVYSMLEAWLQVIAPVLKHLLQRPR